MPAIVLILLLLAACSGRSEEPGDDSTATPAEPEPTATEVGPTWTPQPTATPAPTQPPTAVPTLDPDVIDNPPDWEPQLVLSSPARGEESLLDGAITLRFDQPMDTGSVEEAFSIEPAVDGEIQWPRPDLMIFTPRAQLTTAQNYQVLVASTAKGTNGLFLREPIKLDVQTIGELNVSAVIPADGTADIDVDGSITVLFNRPVVPLVATQDQAGLINPITVSPPLEGTGEWISTSIYRFTPANGFAGATNYSVTVAAGLTDVTGAVLSDQVNSRFTTQQPRVENTVPFPNQSLWPLEGAPFEIRFNMAMDRANTENAISLSPAAPLTFEWNENNTRVTISPTQRLDIETSYTLTVDRSATAASGEGGLDQTTTIQFNTVPLPRVVRTDPNNGERNARPYGVSIEFSAPIDWTTVEDRIIIDPEPDRVRYNFFEGEVWLWLNFPMKFNQEYTLTIPGDVADPYGNTLGEDYVLQFTTGEATPNVRFNLPHSINQFSASFAPQIDVNHINADRLDLTLTDAGLPLQQAFYGEFWDELPGATVLKEWSVDPNETENEESTTRVDLSLNADGQPLPTGIYMLTVTSPKFDDEPYRADRRLLVVADTNLVVKETVNGVYVWATDMGSGQPAPGRLLALYNERFEQVGTAETDQDGIAFFDVTRNYQYFEGFLAISETPGGAGFGFAGTNWSQGASPWELGINLQNAEEQTHRGYLYTDRPLYRPGDTVEFKGVLRDQDYGRYTPFSGPTSVTVEVNENSFYGPNEPFNESLSVDVQPNGSFSGQFTLPDGVNPGQYFVNLDGNYRDVSILFQVAEFRKPEFEVAVEAAEPELLRGTATEVTVQADYFFGGAASDLELNYTVYTEGFTFGSASPFSFGLEDSRRSWWWDGPSIERIDLLNGSGRTDGNGSFVVELPADLLAELEAGSRTVTVEATVFDVNFQPFSARTSLTFHGAELYVGIQSDQYLSEATEPADFNLLTADWEGAPLGNIPVEVTFYRREWQRNDDGFYESVDIEIDKTSVTTNGEGEAQVTFTPPEAGSYKAVAIATDSGGRTHESAAFLWVYGSGGSWRIEPNQKTMEIVPDQTEYAVGDIAQLLIQSPFEGSVTAWLNIERGKLLEQRLITLESTGDTLAIPISIDHVPNIHVTIIAIKGENEVSGLPTAADYADIRVGIVELPVKIDPFTLNVNLQPRLPESGLLQPGETATFDVEITDQNGQPVAGTLSLALVDNAIFALAADNATPIADAFYNRQPLRSLLGSGLILSGEGYERPPEENADLAEALPTEAPVAQSAVAEEMVEEEALMEAEMAFDDSAADGEAFNARAQGGGGGAPPAGIDVRSDFKDTAYWEAEITTDANGQAVIEIPLPDNLTTWNLHVKGINEQTLVGQSDTEITVQKPILVRPTTPRFFTVGDIAEIGTVINNNTDTDQTLNVLIEGTGFEFIEEEGGETGTVTVPAGGSAVFRQAIRIVDREVDFVDLTFTTWNDTYSDASKPTFGFGPEQLIPVYRYNAEDITATSGVLTDEQSRRVEAVLLPEGVDADFGDLAFKLNGSLAAAILDTLEVHNDDYYYDTSCAHAIASRLIPNAVTARTINQLNLGRPELMAELDELIPTDIEHIMRAQKGDGGWGWCTYPESSPWFSAYVLLALDKAQEAGYDVPQDQLRSGLSYLSVQLESPDRLSGQRYKANAQAFYHYVLVEHGVGNIDMAADLYLENRENLDAYAKGLLLIALADERPDLKDTLLAEISGEALVSATGAHWEDDDWNNLSSDIRATAIMIMAFAQVSPDEPFGPQAVNWLMGARQAQVWRSRHDTSWVLLGLTDWLAETGELQGDFDYSILLNGTDRTAADSGFTRETIAETERLNIPMADLHETDLNFVDLQKNGNGRLYYNAWLDTFIPADLVGPIDRGLSIERVYYDAACSEDCEPITEIAAGQQIRVELTIITKRDLVYAVIEDYFPAGAEAIDPNLPISQTGLDEGIQQIDSGDRWWGWWGWWYFDNIAYRDERITFTSNFLPAGTYRYTYNLNATLPGTYQVRPTFGREEFTPEVNGRGAGEVFTVTNDQ